MEWMPVATDWGYANTKLGFNKSQAKFVNDDVITRMQRGEVKRMRPQDASVGRNIKFCNRHSASLCVMSPNYGELDNRRAIKEARTLANLNKVASMGELPFDDASERAKLCATIGKGAYGPFCGSLPRFVELRNNVLVHVPQPGC
jgi:hypothetical protein